MENEDLTYPEPIVSLYKYNFPCLGTIVIDSGSAMCTNKIATNLFPVWCSRCGRKHNEPPNKYANKEVTFPKAGQDWGKVTHTTLGEVTPDMVNHPPHYVKNDIEIQDVIEAYELDTQEAHAVEYIVRAKEKEKGNRIQDLQKAVWYLNRKIFLLQKEFVNGSILKTVMGKLKDD